MNTHKLWNKLNPSPSFESKLVERIYNQPVRLFPKVAIGAMALCTVLVIGMNEWHRMADVKKIHDIELYEEYMEPDQVTDMMLVYQ